MKKQILSEEFKRMQKLADISLVENIIQEEEDLLEKYKEKIDQLLEKYKEKIDQLRYEFIADLKSNLEGIEKLSKEDREELSKKLSKMVRNLTFTVYDIF